MVPSKIKILILTAYQQYYDEFRMIIFKLLAFYLQNQGTMACFQAFNNICKKIVHPARHNLNEQQMIERKFRSSSVVYDRLEVQNSFRQKLSVIVFEKSFSLYPTVLYLHGNGGHKLQSLQIAFQNINLIAFDFCGCGKSEGEFITYGQKEVNDIRAVVEEIIKKYDIEKLAIWGRSMGASLAIMYTAKYPEQVYSLILDTPFRFLRKVVFNVADHGSSIPKFLLNILVYFVEKRTESIVEKDVFGVDFSLFLDLINIPVLFAYSTKDTVVREQDVKELYNIYNGYKSLSRIESLHHQDRPKSFIKAGYRFLTESLSFTERGLHRLRDSKYSYSKKAFIKDPNN